MDEDLLKLHAINRSWLKPALEKLGFARRCDHGGAVGCAA